MQLYLKTITRTSTFPFVGKLVANKGPSPTKGLPRQRAFPDKGPSPIKGLPQQRAFPDKGPSPTKGLLRQRAFRDKGPSPTKGLPRQRAFPDKGPSPTKGLLRQRAFARNVEVLLIVFRYSSIIRNVLLSSLPILRTDCLRLHIYIIIKQIIHQFGVSTAHSHGFDNEIMKIVLVKPTLWLFQITTTAGSFNRPALKSSISCVNYQNV